MTHKQWVSALRSKVESSWNLHALLPKDLDFFVLLSSASGIIGNPGQANYAAGCTFQDALAKYRVHQNQKAVSIDLGVMRDIGVVAENEDLKRRLQSSWGAAQVKKEEFLTALDIYCDPSISLVPPEKSQFAMGVPTAADFLAQGLEPTKVMRSPLFAYFNHARGKSGTAGSSRNEDPGDLFRQAGSVDQAAMVVVASLTKKLARALSIQSDEADTSKPLHAFGVDSLVAVELRNWISKEFSADVPVSELMGGRSVAAIGELVATVRLSSQNVKLAERK
ncbi:hypothetical protein Hte_010257 [Hypoxylon texense]